MPQNTGVKNRINYFERLVKEDAKFAVNDEKYGEYLKSLGTLVGLTNEIYGENDGKLDKEKYEALVRQYLDVMQKSIDYKEKSTDKTRMSIVNYIQKVISKDLKALNDLDKEKPGNIKNIFETSRTMKVVVSSEMTHRVGGQLSDRFPMKNGDKKGFFTARIDTAQDEKWKKVLNSVKDLKLSKDIQEMFDELEHDHELRKEVYSVVFSKRFKEESERRKALAETFGLFDDHEEKYETIEKDQKLVKALDILLNDTPKLLAPYNIQKRLGLDPYTRNDNKNAAMYDVAKFLGCERVIAKAVPMVVVNGDKVIKGTFMENAEGSDLSNMKPKDPMWSYDEKQSPYNKGLYCDLADLQLIDYICGNVDRHKANMFYKTKKDKDGSVKITGLVGIDNDASFPENNIDDQEFQEMRVGDAIRPPRIFRPHNFRYVTRKTAEMVNNMSRSQLETILRGRNISEDAIKLAWERTKEIQDVLKQPEMFGISYADDLTENVTREAKDSLNPFHINDAKFKPSIFTGFNSNMTNEVGYSYYLALSEQEKRLSVPEGSKNQLDFKEYKAYMKQKNAPENIAQYQDASGKMAIVANETKIQRLETVMKKINRLKFASSEFAKMRTAVKNLVECSNEIRNKVKEATELEKDDYKKYEDCLKKLNEATEHYIQEKGIVQKTGKGRERMEGARKILNIAEDISRSFAAEKHMEETEKEAPNDNQEMERV